MTRVLQRRTLSCLLATAALLIATNARAIESEVLWYNGDHIPQGPSIDNRGSDQDFRVYDNFIVPTGETWSVDTVFSHNLMFRYNATLTAVDYEFSEYTADFEIRSGVSEHSGGTLLHSGNNVAMTATFRNNGQAGFKEYRIAISGLDITLPSGEYWLMVRPRDPTGNNRLRSRISGTSGTNAVGTPAGNDQNVFLTGHNFAETDGSFAFFSLPSKVVGLGSDDKVVDFSMGVEGTRNSPPLADAGADQTVECTSPNGASVTLHGSGSDPDDDELTFTWDVPDGIVLDDPSSPTPSGVFPIGVTIATLTVTDGKGGVAVDDVAITVVDSHPPEVACSTDTPALFPPNHKMVEVGVFIGATDACTAPGALRLVSVLVTSNEPDNGLGDGDTAGDVNGHNAYTAPVNITSAFSYSAATEGFQGSVKLRAERSGDGVGRSYTIEATVIDTAGNTAVTSCVVVVPHDRRKK